MLKVVITALMVLLATALMMWLGRFVRKTVMPKGPEAFVQFQLRYQIGLLAIASLVLAGSAALSLGGSINLLLPGDIHAPANAVDILGIAQNESWFSVGSGLMVGITLVTFGFLTIQALVSRARLSFNVGLLLWVLLFALLNSFSEEAIFRVAVIGSLQGELATSSLLLLSAVLFGLPHLRGIPNGIIGVMLATALGWVLAKSVVETGGMFWAWSIHFLQDVVIFSSLMLLRQPMQAASDQEQD